MKRLSGYGLNFLGSELKPYKTAHDKLLKLGFKDNKTLFTDGSINHIRYESDGITIYVWYYKKTYHIYNIDGSIDLELSKILTQYLEELENE